MKWSFILPTLLFLIACHKHNSGNSGNAPQSTPYDKQIIINETLANGVTAPYQNALDYFALHGDPNTQIMVASRGLQDDNDARGFRIASINKINGTVNWVKSYDLPDNYQIQHVTCAAIDNLDNIWIGGHSFSGTGTAGILFLAKLDTSGNILWTGSLSNYQGWRAYSLTVLQNGDLAFFAKNVAGFTVLRFTANEQPVWSTIVDYVRATIDDDYYNTPSWPYGPENHGMAQTADGSIYVATSSNPSDLRLPSADRLYKLNANGNLQFAKIYTLPNTGPIHPVQLINAGANNLLMADQCYFGGGYGTTPSPFFNLLSLDGTLVASAAYPINQTMQSRQQINEVNYYNNSIYYSATGLNELNTYILDGSLNLKSSVETTEDNDQGLDQGAVSLFDSTNNALYYLSNFAGGQSPNDGFEITRTDATGKSCITTFTTPAFPLPLENFQITVATDTLIQDILAGPAPIFTPLAWRSYLVPVVNTEAICGQ